MSGTSLRAVYREAQALEFDVSIDAAGCLHLVKRGASLPRYHSLLPANDPRVVADAWAWLASQRAAIARADAHRAR